MSKTQTVRAAALAASRRFRNRRAPAWWSLSECPYAIVFQLHNDALEVPFERLWRAVELVLGRDVEPSEFLHPMRLRSEIESLLRPK